MPGWQDAWEAYGRGFDLVGVAEDAEGAARVRPVVEAAGVSFPVVVDRDGSLSRALAFRIVPSAFFVAADGRVEYRHTADCDIGDPRVRWNLGRFADGLPTREPAAQDPPPNEEAHALFARGLALAAGGDRAGALEAWERARDLDPENFLIRSQIWVARHPERFYPAVDRAWQSQQLLAEGYDGPLP